MLASPLGISVEKTKNFYGQFLDAPNVSTLTISDATTTIYAEVFRKLRQTGTPIGTNDMWIAAMTLERGASLLTLDADFSNVPGLVLVSTGIIN